jgi:hypothetical protein
MNGLKVKSKKGRVRLNPMISQEAYKRGSMSKKLSEKILIVEMRNVFESVDYICLINGN